MSIKEELEIINIKGKLHDNIYIDVEISNNHILDGGVYVFYINKDDEKNEEDKKILYVGETNLFSRRISHHIIKLKKEKSYFGLGMLKENYTITLKIHGGYPYNFDNNKDENRRIRQTRESEFLVENHGSLTQCNTNSAMKKDSMLDNEAPDYNLDKSMLKVLEPDNYKKMVE